MVLLCIQFAAVRRLQGKAHAAVLIRNRACFLRWRGNVRSKLPTFAVTISRRVVYGRDQRSDDIVGAAMTNSLARAVI
jgi:hypothetical protein